jgi:hypothetical protein
LNDEGLRLIKEHLKSSETTAVPVDLGAGRVASFWYQKNEGKNRLLMINHSDEEKEVQFSFTKYVLPAPRLIKADKDGIWDGSTYSCKLKRHESAVLELLS